MMAETSSWRNYSMKRTVRFEKRRANKSKWKRGGADLISGTRLASIYL